VSNTLEIIQQLIKQIRKNIFWVALLSLIFGLINSFFAYQKAPLYKSYSKIFPLTADGGDPLSSMKAQFGMSQQSNLSKYYNVNELVSSKNISRQIVTYPTNNIKYKKLYEWVIEDYNNQQFWNSNKIKPISDSLDKIITASDLMTAATVVKVEKSDFTSIECTTGNPELSLRLNECIIQCLSDFYINSKTEKARTDLMRIGLLKDSLKGSLDYIESAQAGFVDNSKYVVKEVANLPQLKLQRLYEEIAEQYRTTAMAYQNANFKLLSESPIFQVLDKPVGPVKKLKDSWIKAFIIGFLLSFIVILLFSIRQLIFNLILKELKSS